MEWIVFYFACALWVFGVAWQIIKQEGYWND